MAVFDHKVDEWEISRDRIGLREVIGSGAFGAVWRATLAQPNGGRGKQIVAAKCFTRKIYEPVQISRYPVVVDIIWIWDM